jgi:hypothetical protein
MLLSKQNLVRLRRWKCGPSSDTKLLLTSFRYYGDTYDPVALSEITNTKDDPEEAPGNLVGEVRAMLILGKAVRFWRQTLAVIGAIATASIAVSYVRRPRW